MRLRPSLALVLAALCLGACSDVRDDAREAWLISTLSDDNRDLFARDPDLVRQKYALMASAPYPFFRGTAPQYLRDAQDPSTPGALTQYASPQRSRVALVGDPHPENVGSYRIPDGTLIAAYNDFDAARHGPFHFDVRRLALGFAVAGVHIEATSSLEVDERAWAEASCQGYVDELANIDAGAERVALRRRENAGAVIDDIFRRAQRDGDAREEIFEYTRLVDGERVMFEGQIELPGETWVEDFVVPASAAEREHVEALLQNYVRVASGPFDRDWIEVLGVSRRYGAGVGSYPVLRYYVAVRGETGAPDDDRLLEIKEIRDAAAIPNLALEPASAYRNNGERGVVIQTQFQERPDADVFLGWTTDGALSFRVRERTKYQKNGGVDRIGEDILAGDISESDAIEYAYLAGRLLASGHAFAEDATGRPGRDALVSLAPEGAAFCAETIAFVDGYLPVFLADIELFRAALDSRGPWLGAR